MEHGDDRQAGERYTMRQVSELTGVPENTIRSWERRFGLPQPERSGGNQRRYTQKDAGVIRAIQGARDRGRTMEQAIEDVTSARSQFARIDLPPGDEQVPAMPEPEVDDRTAPADLLVDSLLHLDDGRAGALLSDRTWASTVDGTCVDLLLPARRTIGERLAAGMVTETQARFGHAWIERKLLSAFDQSNPEHGSTRVVVASMHDRSGWPTSLTYAILLSRAGYAVTCLGPAVSAPGARQAVELCSPDALLLVGDSVLSRIAMRELANHPCSTAAEAAWTGLVAAGEQDGDAVGSMAIIPLHPTRTAKDFEQALDAWTSTRHMTRTP